MNRPPKRKPHRAFKAELESATTIEVEAEQPTLLLVPLGATEQHGPHLPMGTDSIIAKEWAAGVAAQLPGAVVAPALPYGSSGEHQSFAGTLSIGHEALQMVLIELARSARTWVDRVAFLSGHAGNWEPVNRAIRQLSEEGHNVIHFFPQWDSETGLTIDAHAGRTETSLLLQVDPGAVREPLPPAGQTSAVGDLLDQMKTDGVEAVAPSGILGDPTHASASEGLTLITSLIDSTVARLRRW